MTISPLPPGQSVFYGPNGTVLANGQVFSYVPGTTQNKGTWADPGQASQNADPLTLSSSGTALLYGWGAYRLIIQDSSGQTISDSLTFGGAPDTTTVVLGDADSGVFTVPPGVYTLYVEVVGGGGAGSNCLAPTAVFDVSGGGGGAGGFGRGIYSVTPGQAISYSVGKGGSLGGQANGGTSNFGGLIVATGGTGSAFTSQGTSAGGAGGTSTGGSIENKPGGAGTDGSHIPPSGGAPYKGPGNGGASRYGAGGTSVNGADGNSGVAPGSGGGGAMDVNLTGNTLNGGSGADGQILITYGT